MGKKKYGVSNLGVGLQPGSDRTVYANWTGISVKKLAGYSVTWQYSVPGSALWFNGSSSTVSAPPATYSAPANANAVLCTVTPAPANKAKWKGVPAQAVYNGGFPSSGGNTTPTKPGGSLELEITGRTLKVSLRNYSSNFFSGRIGFQVVIDDARVVYSSTPGYANGIASSVWGNIALDGHRYKARAMAYGTNGTNSEWGDYSVNKYTPPGKVNNPAVASISESSAKVSWSAASGADTYTVEYTATTIVGPSGTEIPVFDTSSPDVQSATNIRTTYFPATNLETGKRWYFRIRGVNTGGEGDWSSIVSVMLGTKPEKPTVWSYTTVGKIGTPIVFNWVHSSKDGSDQTGAHLGIKINDNEETVINLTTETYYSYDTSSLSDSDTIKWRVSTRGTQGITDAQGVSIEWGDYSEYREIVVYAPPEIVFSVGTPGELEYPSIESFPFSIEGTSSPVTQTPISYYISITSDEQYDISEGDGTEIHVGIGQEIYSKYIVSDSHNLELVLNPGDIYLNKDTTYTVTVTVAMTTGLTGESSQKFIAAWTEPSWSPDADIEIDSKYLVAYVRPFCADQWNFEYREGFTLAVYRIDFDGKLIEIQSGIGASENITVTDLHPSLDFARYRIVATDLTTGIVSYSDLGGEEVGETAAILQWNGKAVTFKADPSMWDDIVNDWSGTILRLPYNVDVSDDISPDVSLVEYIGREHPVSYYGTQKGSTSKWSMEIPKSDLEAIAKIRALAIYPGDVYVREPAGTGYWANIKTSYTVTHNKPTISVSFSITRVEGGA